MQPVVRGGRVPVGAMVVGGVDDDIVVEADDAEPAIDLGG